jgi:replication factor A2
MLGGKELPAGISASAKMVYQVLLSEPQNNEGLHVKEIAQKLGILVRDVFEARDVLLSKGLIYTTVDDEMWAVLD